MSTTAPTLDHCRNVLSCKIPTRRGQRTLLHRSKMFCKKRLSKVSVLSTAKKGLSGRGRSRLQVTTRCTHRCGSGKKVLVVSHALFELWDFVLPKCGTLTSWRGTSGASDDLLRQFAIEITVIVFQVHRNRSWMSICM